jgi:hypothetical protein
MSVVSCHIFRLIGLKLQTYSRTLALRCSPQAYFTYTKLARRAWPLSTWAIRSRALLSMERRADPVSATTSPGPPNDAQIRVRRCSFRPPSVDYPLPQSPRSTGRRNARIRRRWEGCTLLCVLWLSGARSARAPRVSDLFELDNQDRVIRHVVVCWDSRASWRPRQLTSAGAYRWVRCR